MLTWAESLLILSGLLIVICGLIAAWPRKSDLPPVDYSVGRDVYRFTKGVHR